MACAVIPDTSLYSKLKLPNLPNITAYPQSSQKTSRGALVDQLLDDVLSGQRKQHEIEKMKISLKEKALLLDRANLERKQNSQKRKRRKKLVSSRLTREARLHHIPKEEQKYAHFLPLHSLWEQYIRSTFKSGSNELSIRADERLLKIDFHGALFTVINSKCPSLIGLRGIVAKETKLMFQLVTECDELKTVPKKNSIFMMEVDKFRIKMNGDAIVGKPGFRTTKKIKNTFDSRLLLDCLSNEP